uniref:Uncharacterized protein n=1 Tax=Anguilla anguilla TaxID=7936 RepID=A0A0E9PIG6_ANGAN
MSPKSIQCSLFKTKTLSF